MKTYFNKYGFLLLSLIVTICLNGIAQSNTAQTNNKYSCDSQPLGLFRQITGASIEITEGVNETYEVIEESEIREKRWKPSILDEIDPAYKFYLIRNPVYAGKENCGATMEVVGKLISPTGKLFDFKEATYDIFSRKLKFTTVERDGLTYKVEATFYAKPMLVKGMYQDGNIKLKAYDKNLGSVLMEFPFSSWNSH
jgi:hypothetical protein